MLDMWLQIVYHPAQWKDNEGHKHCRQSAGILAHRNWDNGFIMKCWPDFWTGIWGYQELSPFPTAINWTFGQFMNESHSCLKLIKSGSIRLCYSVVWLVCYDRYTPEIWQVHQAETFWNQIWPKPLKVWFLVCLTTFDQNLIFETHIDTPISILTFQTNQICAVLPEAAGLS